MCINDKLTLEAKQHGLTLLGKGKNSNYRLYRFDQCEHEQEIETSSVRKSQFKCNQCLSNKLKNEASKVGLTILGSGRNVAYRLYRFNQCGHEQEIATGCVRINKFTCNQCLSNKLHNESSKVGLTILGSGRNATYRLYRFNQCGHEQEIKTGHVRNNNFKCNQCLSNKLHNESSKVGLTILGSGRNLNYRLYRFNQCQHEQEIQIGHVRNNTFKCNQCDTSHGYDKNKQGLFYLYRWTNPETKHSFLKFGITNNVDHIKRVNQQTRKTQYIPTEEITVRYYLDGAIPPTLERLVFDNLQTGIVDRELFGDGFTETIEDTKDNIQFIQELILINHYQKAA